MQAAAIRRHGDVEALEILDIPDPEPGPGEVVLAVRAAAMNRLDVWVRTLDRFDLAFPHILGSDAAGTVAAVGHGVRGVREGDGVILDPGLSCGRCAACARGEKSLCPDFTLIGAGRAGTFAEKVAVPAANVHPKPGGLDFQAAAALTLDHLTAWRMLMTRARLRPGETVLIHGIGGGAALAGLQIVSGIGARAIVTSSSDAKLEKAVSLGAFRTINYRTQDVAEAVADVTGGQGVDVVFDAVGAATWPINLKAVRKGGRIVHCGVTTGAEVQANLSAIYWNQISILGSTMGGEQEVRDMLRFVEVAGIEPIVDSVHPLLQVREAARRLDSPDRFGKVVLQVVP